MNVTSSMVGQTVTVISDPSGASAGDNTFACGPSSTSSGTVALDFSGKRYQKVVLTGDGTFVTANRTTAAVSARIDSNGTDRNLYFHPDWSWLGVAYSSPTVLSNTKVAVLSLTAFGPNESDVLAVLAAMP